MAELKIGAIASGSGSNLEAIIKACKSGILKNKASVEILICNKAGAFCMERAKNHKIPYELIESNKYLHLPREEYDKKMIEVFLAIALLIALTILLSLYRAALGPGVFNRVAAINVIGTKTIVLLVIIGYYFERPLFFDISLLYAVLNFIGTLAFAKYLERGEVWS